MSTSTPRRIATLAFVLAAAAACRQAPENPPSGVKPDGQSSFESAVPGSGSNGGATRDAAAPGAGAPEAGADAGGGTPRQVEEADIVRLDGDTLYVLNPYRGLTIVDLTDPDAPSILGRAPVFGTPVEMYIRDGVAIMIVSNYFNYWAAEGDAADGFQGSSIRVVDVRNPAAPLLVGEYKVPGFISDTRIVGNVLYAVSNHYPWYDYFASNDTTASTDVLSIDLADPRAPIERDHLSFTGTSNNVHPTSDHLYVAQPVEGRDWNNQATRFTLLDISDPAGDISIASTFDTEGTLGFWNVSQDMARFQMNENGNFFYAITHDGSNGTDGSQKLTAWDISNQAAPTQVSELNIPNSGGLWATRFDGDRVYLVTLVQVDPLEVILLTDPYKPVLVKQLQIPGLLRLVMPTTTADGKKRLLALATDSAWGGGVGMALFDVEDPAHTHELDRVMVNQSGYAWSGATWDDKALRITGDGNARLALLPFSGWMPSTDPGTGEKTDFGKYINALALIGIDLGAGTLTAHGVVEHYGAVQRALPKDDRLVAFSDMVLQSIDATDLDHPKVTAVLWLARDISDFAVADVGGGERIGVQLIGQDWYTQTGAKLRTVSLADPDGERTSYDEVELPLGWGRLYTHGNTIYAVGAERNTSQNMLLSFSVGTDGKLTALGKVQITTGDDYGGWWWYGSSGATLVDGPALAFATTRYVETGIPTPWGGQQWRMVRTVYSIDLRDAANPTLGGKVELPGESYAELVAHGTQVFTSHYEWLRTEADGRNFGRWFVDRVELSDPAAPRLLASVNVPGTFAAISGDGQLLYTVDYQYGQDANGNWQAKNTLNVLWLWSDRAILQDSDEIAERIDRLTANGHAIYTATQPWWWDPAVQADANWWKKSTLRVFDASAPTDTHEVRAIALDGAFGIRDLIGGRLFLTLGGGGWGWAYMGFGGGAVRGGGVADAGVGMPGFWYGGYGGQGLLVYDVSHELSPSFLGFFRTFGWVNQIAVAGERAFLASGLYGVQTVPLARAF